MGQEVGREGGRAEGRGGSLEGGKGWGKARGIVAAGVGSVLPECIRRTIFDAMMPFERLEAWRSSHELALAICRLTSGWPTTERFGMTAQLRRAAISIPSNIVEGNAKRGTRELRRYLDISLGSFAEVTYLLMLARDLGLPLDDSVEQRRCRTGRQLWGLYHSVAHS